MCGIAGYVQRASSPHRPIERMTARLAHRGPDGQGIWEGRFGDDWSIALGHRRLSIIDPAGGHQPLSNCDQSAWITYNGEVYNFIELRARLERKGHSFSTHCDTEAVLLHLQDVGDDGLSDLQGMFAFAIWDASHGRLLLARDRIGIKPLFYANLPDGGLAFASELTALLEHPAISRELDADAITCLFFLDYIPPPHSIVRGARKLEPGNSLTWTAENPHPVKRAYWQLDPGLAVPGNDPAAELRSKLSDAVSAQMLSDVPLGMFLSGGIDSSLVAALAQERTREPLKTFSIAFEDPEFDESQHARAVAKHIGSRHVERTLSQAMLLQTLDAALDCLDEPIGDPSIVPTYLLSQLAAEHVKVALGGDGGDELWAGYPTYLALNHAKVMARVPAVMRERLIAPLVRALPVRQGYQSLEWKLKRFVLRWDDRPAMRHLRWMSNTDLPQLAECLEEEVGWPEGLERLTGGSNGRWDLNSALAMDLKSYLPGAVLTKVDRASMAHGLEVRPPMLHEPLVDFAFSLPPAVKLAKGTTKALLKSSARGLLPDSIIDRPKKGFAIPLARWINGPLRPRLRAVLAEGRIWESGTLNRATFEHWATEHQTGVADHSKPLWALLVLDRFYTAKL